MKKNKRFKLILILLAPLIMVINLMLKQFPGFVEGFYSTAVNKVTREILSLVTGILPISIAELLFYILVITLFVLVILLMVKLKTGGFKEHVLTVLSFLSVLYILFMVLWGFNYDRLSFDKIAGLKVQNSSEQELYNLCRDLIQRANTLRTEVKEDSNGVMTVPGGYKDILKRAGKGYEKASVLYPSLGGKYGPPKPVLLSEQMCYTGITGIYMPYTGEPNVNVKITDLMLPCTAAHEMAHQRGFAREDEANYIAYLVCSMHPDADFQYSGVMLALINSMNALANQDLEKARELAKEYSAGVARDLRNESDFWSKYEGKVQTISDNINDSYLKSNGQADGVQSYGRMVDLLLAEYRKKAS